ncbi:MAG: (d)CMP kinase [Alphaproteobacteria bacterium]|nr:(d)CMP kinase [Alphaproteobacteria bacterium]
MIVAVDGPAASGKGTLARRLAAHLGYAHLDTGKLYRAVGHAVLAAGQDPEDAAAATRAAKSLRIESLGDPALLGDAAAAAASKVAAIPCVRAALLRFQQDFAQSPPGEAAGAVLDGRDIGTVVCPGAEAKLFITAEVAVRAERRHKELIGSGQPSIYAQVLQDLKERDARDSNRAVAPLRPARDAKMLDTSALDPDAVFAAALAYIEKRRSEDTATR